MPTAKFSDLALLWPFANELDETVFVYKEYKEFVAQPNVPPNDGMAMFAISAALGRIAMDNSIPRFHLVGHQSDIYKADKTRKHLIYIGGPIQNERAKQFLTRCKRKKMEMKVHLPPKKEPKRREMRIDGENSLQAEYSDPDFRDVTTDYGLIFLADNPFATGRRFKALLVAGLHSYGTLAAAKFASDPQLSAEIIRRIMSIYHVPPHLLKTIEVVVKADVLGDNTLADSEQDHIQRIFINGRPIYDVSKTDEGHEQLILAARQISVAGNSGNKPINIGLGSGTSFQIRLRPDRFDSSEASVPMTEIVKEHMLTDQFFEYFSRCAVIVVSPHSDDSAIACGGLMYYLRNMRLWRERYKTDSLPRVDVLVMTKSSRGVDDLYFERYCECVGAKATFEQKEKAGKQKLDEFMDMGKGEIRYNERLVEAMLLSVHSHWLDLSDMKADNRVFEELKLIFKEYDDKWIPLFLVPNFGEQHHTHKGATELILRIIRSLKNRESLPKLKDALVWLYESPWSFLDPADINVIIPLDRHAMFAKCQAISVHQSQENRTQFSDVAWNRSRFLAETLPETVYGFGGSAREWNYLEVFSARDWDLKDYSLQILFSIESDSYQADLDNVKIPKPLIEAAEKKEIQISENAVVSPKEDDVWLIKDEDNQKKYLVRKDQGRLKVYDYKWKLNSP